METTAGGNKNGSAKFPLEILHGALEASHALNVATGIAMSLFVMLGGMVVVFLRQSLDIFYTGTRESAQLDRQDTVLPQGPLASARWRFPRSLGLKFCTLSQEGPSE